MTINLKRLYRGARTGALAAGLTGCLTAMTLGLTSGSAVADHAGVTSGADHASLAEAATNPIANLTVVSAIDQYNWDNYQVDSDSNAALFQAVVPFKPPSPIC